MRLFLILATLLILEKLVGVGFALSGGLSEIRWLRSVVQPLGFAFAIAWLWQGDAWLRWLVGFACVLTGGLTVYVSGRILLKLAELTPAEATRSFMLVAGYPLGFLALIGALHLIVGLLFLFEPGMRAFFRLQRERLRPC